MEVYERAKGASSVTDVNLANFLLIDFNDDNKAVCEMLGQEGKYDSALTVPLFDGVQYLILVVRSDTEM